MSMKKKIRVLMQMTSFGCEPRHCKCGGKFNRGEAMNATEDDGWWCSSCVRTKPGKHQPGEVPIKKKGKEGVDVERLQSGIIAKARDYNTKLAKKLWEKLGDIPIDEDECIEVSFTHHPIVDFPAGTDREYIWHWFEETFDVSVYLLMYPKEKLDLIGGFKDDMSKMQ